MAETNMKILWLATDRSNRVADIFGPLQRCVADMVDVDFIYRHIEMLPKSWQQTFTTGNRKPARLVIPKKANEYDFIMVDAPFAFLDEAWDKIKTPKGVLIEDQHGDVLRYSKRYVELGFDIFFTRYNNILDNHKNLQGQTIKWLPHSIDPNIFNDYKEFKKYNCLMVGRLHEKVYPLRWKIHQQLVGSNLSYFKVDRPEEYTEKDTRWPVGRKYASLINSSRITFSCMSKFKYPVMKFFEIPGCNSVLFSDYNKELKQLGFEPNKNMVRIDKTDNIRKFIIEYLREPDKLKEISQNGYDLVHKRHTAKKRSEEFLERII